MSFVDHLLHFLIPRPSNNHHAKALHTSSISIYIVILLVFQIFLSGISSFHPEILGYASNINATDLLNNTNAKRVAAGVAPLSISDQLSSAAANKGADMLAKQYWAHVSPDGKDPWNWIVSAGYNYVFAGENLARDFGDSTAVVDAWMNSPSHKENLLNVRFKDVGFAVINGKFDNSETTLVVQEFGSRASQPASVEAPPATPPVVKIDASPSSVPPTPPPTPKSGSILSVKPVKPNSLPLDVIALTKLASMSLLIVLISVLALDSILVYRRKVVRLSGHNFAHMLILLTVLVALNLIGRGIIL